MENIEVLILGSGPAGYTAAIYASRAGLKPVVYSGLQPGGQLTITTEVENFPGYPDGVTGPEMMQQLQAQAERFGTETRMGLATKVDFSSYPHKVTIDNETEITAEAVIIATGASAKWLGLESEQKFNGQGVSACATCDGFFYKEQDVVVVGGGDTAAEEAVYLSNICNKVYMVVRRDELRASKVMQERVASNPKIEVLWNTNTDEILGDMAGVNAVRLLNNKTNEKFEIAVTGFFVAIGHQPNTEIFNDILDMDNEGYLITEADCAKTNVEGIFACGDVQDTHYRQAVTAAGSGCKAAIDAERFLGEKRGE